MKDKITYTYIMIHHSLSPDGDALSWDNIMRWHKAKGWKDIGYHAGVERIEGTYQALVGRPLGVRGAHCLEGNMNEKAIGICCVGNYDLATPSDEMVDVLVCRLLTPLMRAFSIPVENIVFHRDFATYKSCPGGMFSKGELLEKIKG